MTCQHSLLTPDELAGVIAGCVVFGILLGVSTFVCFMYYDKLGIRTKLPNRSQPSYPTLNELLRSEQTWPDLYQGHDHEHFMYLLREIDMKADQYVERHCRKTPVDAAELAESINEQARAKFGLDTTMTTHKLVNALAGTKRRLEAARGIIVRAVLNRIGLECPLVLTLLPPDFAACTQHIASVPNIPRQQRIVTAFWHTNPIYRLRWLQLSGMLLPGPFMADVRARESSGERPDPSTRPDFEKRIETNIKVFASDIEAAFGPIIVKERADERYALIHEIAQDACRLGFDLATQPYVWELDWTLKDNFLNRSRGAFVTLPSIKQITDLNMEPHMRGYHMGKKWVDYLGCDLRAQFIESEKSST